MADLGISTIVTLIGTAVSGVASYASASSNAAIMEMNAQISEDNARRSIDRVQLEQEEQDRQAAAIMGQMISDQAASGVDLGFGSTRYTQIAARELARKDSLNLRQAGELEAYNHKVAAASGHAQAQATKTAGAFNLLGSFLDAGSTLTSAMATKKPASSYYPVPKPKPGVLV